MINTKKFQYLTEWSAFKHQEWEGYLVNTDMITEAYTICVGWAASQGFTILNLGFVGNELFVTYETNKGLGEE